MVPGIFIASGELMAKSLGPDVPGPVTAVLKRKLMTGVAPVFTTEAVGGLVDVVTICGGCPGPPGVMEMVVVAAAAAT